MITQRWTARLAVAAVAVAVAAFGGGGAQAATTTNAADLTSAGTQYTTGGAAYVHPGRPDTPTVNGTYLYHGTWKLNGLILHNAAASGALGGGATLWYQSDGNLVEYCNTAGILSIPVWASNTAGATGTNGNAVLAFQSDGNLVIYNNGIAIWSTKTNNHSNDYAVLQNDDNFVIYVGTIPLWSTRTNGAC
jgi:hypothetical protein